jgi:excisionase family DNA binding protein
MTTDVLLEDVKRLDEALVSASREVVVTLRLPLRAARLTRDLLAAERKSGAAVIPARSEFTTTETAAILNVSRATVMKMLSEGRLSARKVGSHHRITAESLLAAQAAEEADRMKALDDLATFSNKIGLTE